MRSLVAVWVIGFSSICWSQTACVVRTITWAGDDSILVHCDGSAVRRELSETSKSTAVSVELKKLIAAGLKVQSCAHPNDHNSGDYNCILTR